jgi:hypothetical protein
MHRKEKQILSEIKSLYRNSRRRLADIRRAERENRPPKQYTNAVDKIVTARKAGLFKSPEHEMHEVNRLLDDSELTNSERTSLNRRKKRLQDLTSSAK